MSEQSKGCRKLEGRVLEYSADSVEWCPVQRCAHLLLCGTYQLKESDDNRGSDGDSKKNQRLGKLYTFEYNNATTKNSRSNNENTHNNSFDDVNNTNNNNNNNNNNIEVKKSLALTQESEMQGVLDVKWSYEEVCEKVTYAVANADGEVTLWTEDGGSDDGDVEGDGEAGGDDGGVGKRSHVNFVKVGRACNGGEGGALALSLDWDNAVDNSSSPQLVVSYSDGGVAVVRVDGMEVVARWLAHDFEAWICAFNYYNKNVVYTGGDDCRLKGWDLRSDRSHPTFVSKQHQMGVCSIQQNFFHENILATGSYDERVLIWDQRSMKVPLGEVSVGGGVWRVKWEPQGGTHVAVAGMHGGFHVVDCFALCGKSSVSELDVSPKVVVSYHEHTSLAYGVDWCKLPAATTTSPGSTGQMLASCSFYDCLLNLWTLER